MPTEVELAAQVMERIEALAQLTDHPGQLTRTYGSPALRRANSLVADWMRQGGMTAREDAVGNLIGRYAGARTDAKTLLLGSHLDTVCNAGKFDGSLGVLVAIACVQHLSARQQRLPFALEVVAFADEEGVRFHNSLLGSRAFTGSLTTADLNRADASGITLAEAIRQFGGRAEDLASARRDPLGLLGYVEVHIEQGPVLEARSLPVGAVSAINGQTRAQARFIGRAAHAGTTPMSLRRDALVAAAEFVLMLPLIGNDDPELVATVGKLDVRPGVSNVVPGEVSLTVDVRHPEDERRAAAVERLRSIAGEIQKKTGVLTEWKSIQETDAVTCSSDLTALLKEAARAHVDEVIEVASGAGHDAVALARITPVAMLFVRCKEGISHHPDESVQGDDVRVAIAVMNDFLERMRRQCHA